MIAPTWTSKSWWHELQEVVVDALELEGKTGVFLRYGKDMVKKPSWKTMAFLVDGTIATESYGVHSIIAEQMRALPDGLPDHLSPEEWTYLATQLEDPQVMQICSVVQVPPIGKSEENQTLIDNAKTKIIK